MAEDATAFEVEKSISSLDFATVIGLASGFGLVAIAVFIGGSLDSFFNTPAMLIVIGETLLVTAICFSLAEKGRPARVVAKTLSFNSRNTSKAAIDVLQSAESARKQGILSPQNTLDSLQSDPFLHKGITMGLIGTLIGLAQMLGNLDDSPTIGPSMAVVLLTTFYGAVLANIFFSPRRQTRVQFDGRSHDQHHLCNGHDLGRATRKSTPAKGALEQRAAALDARALFRIM